LKTPVHHEETDELLGYIVKDTTGWQAQTIFGITIARTEDQAAAEATLRERGLSYLTGVWQYLDKDDKDWHPCVLKEVYEKRVIVMRTNEMGYEDPDDYKRVIIEHPTEEVLVKAS
tara:strand:+ start:180 stop:527 length:348 start_codon:yes stop_codon:yes gene_type:complete